jgi:hypothetical protein
MSFSLTIENEDDKRAQDTILYFAALKSKYKRNIPEYAMKKGSFRKARCRFSK